MTAHWSDRFLNLPHTQFNCAALCTEIQRQIFGREVVIPSELPDGIRDQNRILEEQFWKYVRPATRAPKDGDVALMVCGGRLRHVGTCCLIGRHRYVLHAVRSLNRSVRCRDLELHHYGLRLEGWYEWR